MSEASDSSPGSRAALESEGRGVSGEGGGGTARSASGLFDPHGVPGRVSGRDKGAKPYWWAQRAAVPRSPTYMNPGAYAVSTRRHSSKAVSAHSVVENSTPWI